MGAPNAPVITGYYRYTDIWFEWHQVVPPEDSWAVKAFFAHDSLASPEHPLRRSGDKGIEMHMGMLSGGDTRLLFSSKQVDYARYWLHTMGATKNYLPLPYSDCLLTASDLLNVSPVSYASGKALKDALKMIDKNNKRLKGGNPLLNSRRDMFERVRTFFAEKSGTWMAIDFEGWDLDHTLITELGWSTIWWEDGEEKSETGHVVVKRKTQYRSSTYIESCPENYLFGTSEYLTMAELKEKIHDLINVATKDGALFLVFHDNNQDIKYLLREDINAPLSTLTHFLPDAHPSDGIFVVDTALLFQALEGDGDGNKKSLERICRHLQIRTDYLHNAGNDAHFTMLAAKSMAEGDPVDIQREKRWPRAAPVLQPGVRRGTKVQFNPYEEDSDYDDEEGLFPPTEGEGMTHFNPETGSLEPDEEVVAFV